MIWSPIEKRLGFEDLVIVSINFESKDIEGYDKMVSILEKGVHIVMHLRS